MLGKIAPEDYRFVPLNPDPGFSVEHNQRVIAETIRKTKLMAKRKKREWENAARERTNAVAQYVKAIDTGTTDKSVLEYFGKQELLRLRGEEIKQSLTGNFTDAKEKEISEAQKKYATRHR